MIAPLARPTAVSDAFRAEHRYWHDQFMRHRCPRCAVGGTCRTADWFAANADAAGWRWAEAEMRHKEVMPHSTNETPPAAMRGTGSRTDTLETMERQASATRSGITARCPTTTTDEERAASRV